MSDQKIIIFNHLRNNIFLNKKVKKITPVDSGGISDVYKLELLNADKYYCKVIIPGKIKMLDEIPRDMKLFFSNNRQKYEIKAIELFNKYSTKFILPTIYAHDEAKFILVLRELKGKLLSEHIITYLNKTLVEELAIAVAELINKSYQKIKSIRGMEEDEKIRRIRIKYLYTYNFNKIKIKYPQIIPLVSKFKTISLQQKSCLCHGDYQPKNIIITPSQRIGLIDFEEAIIHDPAFDIAFLSARLILESVNNKKHQNKILNMTKLLVKIFLNNLKINEDKQEIQYRINNYIAGAVMLRVDGISKAKWINKKQANSLRKFSAYLLMHSKTKTIDLLKYAY